MTPMAELPWSPLDSEGRALTGGQGGPSSFLAHQGPEGSSYNTDCLGGLYSLFSWQYIMSERGTDSIFCQYLAS